MFCYASMVCVKQLSKTLLFINLLLFLGLYYQLVILGIYCLALVAECLAFPIAKANRSNIKTFNLDNCGAIVAPISGLRTLDILLVTFSLDASCHKNVSR